MATWQLAPSLARFRQEVNTAYPRRSTASDGDLGDAAHRRNTSSDHNPYYGYVHAWDVTKVGVDMNRLLKAGFAHPSTNYVIHNRTIWTNASGFRPRAYYGSNPHTLHAHFSVFRNTAARNSTRSWLSGVASAPVAPTADRHVHQMPVFRENPVHNIYIRDLQGHLNYWRTIRGLARVLPDGYFGPSTSYVVRVFQQAMHLSADGIVGPTTWSKLHAEVGSKRLESDGRGF